MFSKLFRIFLHLLLITLAPVFISYICVLVVEKVYYSLKFMFHASTSFVWFPFSPLCWDWIFIIFSACVAKSRDKNGLCYFFVFFYVPPCLRIFIIHFSLAHSHTHKHAGVCQCVRGEVYYAAANLLCMKHYDRGSFVASISSLAILRRFPYSPSLTLAVYIYIYCFPLLSFEGGGQRRIGA